MSISCAQINKINSYHHPYQFHIKEYIVHIIVQHDIKMFYAATDDFTFNRSTYIPVSKNVGKNLRIMSYCNKCVHNNIKFILYFVCMRETDVCKARSIVMQTRRR